jgi:very-short-patch-repair endonuclease
MKDCRRYRTAKERRILERRKNIVQKQTGYSFDPDRISSGHWRRVQYILQKKKNGINLTQAERTSLLSFYRKSLKRRPTNGETGMGKLLNILNIKYIFQKQFGCYIVDFYLTMFDIVVEVDGPQHYTDKKVIVYDLKRSEYLLKRGVKVIRFTNEKVINETTDTAKKIVDIIREVTLSTEEHVKEITTW